MFCPKCGAEYREGYTRCADCETDLVEKLPEEDVADNEEYELDPDVKFVEILTTNNLSDVAFIKSILDDAGITYFIKNERMQNLDLIYDSSLMVLQEEEKKARELLKGLDLKYNRFAGGL